MVAYAILLQTQTGQYLILGIWCARSDIVYNYNIVVTGTVLGVRAKLSIVKLPVKYAMQSAKICTCVNSSSCDAICRLRDAVYVGGAIDKLSMLA